MLTPHRRIVIGVLIACALVLLLAGTATAQPTTDADSAASRVYRLGVQSTYRNACFDPCDCVMDIRSPLEGTMILTPRPLTTPGTRVFAVSDVNFRITMGGATQLVRGRGVYTWTTSIGMLTVLGHRLELDLSVGDAPLQHFDSGLVPGATVGQFPPINIVIDKNNQVCVDEVLTIAAAPVDEREIARYCMMRPSNAVEGCFDPCACPILLLGDIRGSFALVRLPSRSLSPTAAGPVSYAVVRLDWTVGHAPSVTTVRRVTGSGFYDIMPPSLIEGTQRMTLALSTNGQAEQGFRGIETIFRPPPVPPGRIDISVNMNGMVCYDRVFEIHAIRCLTAAGPVSVDSPALQSPLAR